MMTSFTTFFFTFLSLFAMAISLPVARLQTRDVFVPPITYPHAGTIWKVGDYHNVTWNTDDAPVNITNSVGEIYLVVQGLIDFNHKLGGGFNIRDGRTVVQVPSVSPANDYAIVLFGDSGNFSPNFTITS
ncbi:hypothetical protein BJ138DRAFT_1178735 [Hygrophoropsis aurantiaca]|uniref:Uncharacterized protein n=1 Tax=Hygrophoropsis aurantiaca TaxID=72124 RepID=A0ACB8AH72_9AGAM|nr:hypothetical protein BJ138DRAFT_1178735 [Hygrophoropsis aurantiaca]